MSNAKIEDLFLHPIRLRILLSLSKQKLTPLQLSELLSDVPQATLYRHINKLLQNDLLQVVEERQVRGTVEKVYTANFSARVGGDLTSVSKDDLLRYFTTFMLLVLNDFSQYLEHHEKPDLVADRVSFAQAPLYLNAEETDQFIKELASVVLKWMENKPSPERHRRLLNTIFMPALEAPPESAQS